MKRVKGKILKTLKSVKPVEYLKQDRILDFLKQDRIFEVTLSAPDGYLARFDSNQNIEAQNHENLKFGGIGSQVMGEEIEDDKMESDEDMDDKENTGPKKPRDPYFLNSENCITTKLNAQRGKASEFRHAQRFDSNQCIKTQNHEKLCKEFEQKKLGGIGSQVTVREIEDEKMKSNEDMNDKKNPGPSNKPKDPEVLKKIDAPKGKTSGHISSESETSNFKQVPLSEIDISSFRRPDFNSGSLFDPNLLAAFHQAVIEHIRRTEAERKSRREEANRYQNNDEQRTKVQKVKEYTEDEPLLCFEERCPPGGSDSVILYTTSLRGIRKTLEDCNSVRFLLESFRLRFSERDVSMHSGFREELWRVLNRRTVPPRLFIRGRYIGGAEEVLTLHEQGRLRRLFDGIPADRSEGPCEGCAGIRFAMCSNCRGSHRVMADDGRRTKCSECNENGLIICPVCC